MEILIYNRLKNFLQRNSLVTIFFVSFPVSFVSIVFMPPQLSLFRVVIYIFSFIFLPGLILDFLFFPQPKSIIRSIVQGFLFQLFIVFIIWIISKIFVRIDFFALVTILTFLLTCMLSVFASAKSLQLNTSLSFKMFLKEKIDLCLICSLLAYIILSIYFGQYAVEPNSDGASYLDLARNVCQFGIFKSNMLFPPYDWSNVTFSTGGHPHMFAYFAFSLFFAFGEVSIAAARATLIFTGVLTIIITYILTKEFLDLNTARLTSFVVSTSALILTHSNLIGGPELISALFTIFSIYSVFLSVKTNSKSLVILSAISFFIVWYSWYLNFYALLVVLVCIMIYASSPKKESVGINVVITFLLLMSLIIDDRLISNFCYETIGFPLPLLSLFLIPTTYTLLIHKNQKLPTFSMLLVSIIILLDFILLFLLLTSPQSHLFHELKLSETGITVANIQRDVRMLMRIFDINKTTLYWDMYKTGLIKSIGQIFIFLALTSFVRLNKVKETCLLASFPFSQALIWSFLVVVDGFQPRFVICSSIFYYALAASTIIFLLEHAVKIVDPFKLKKLAIKRKSIKINNKIIASLLLILMITACVGLNLETYDYGVNILLKWNFREKFGWDKCIEWIKANTTAKNILACVYADYFVWYTGRQAVFLWPLSNENCSKLINLIRMLKVNYLVVDKPFRWLFPDLSMLYDQPNEFLGATIVFSDQDDRGNKVIIYNVTNIAYGELVEYELEIDWMMLENWSPLLWYCTGNITTDEASVRIDFRALERPLIAGAATYRFSSLTDLTKYNTLEFWVKVPVAGRIFVEIYTGLRGQNYFIYRIQNNVTNKWTKISINLYDLSGVCGAPDMKFASSLNFIVGDVPLNQPLAFWIKDIKFKSSKYVFETPKP